MMDWGFARVLFLGAVALVAAVTDYRSGLIRNALTFPAMAAALVFSAVIGGVTGLAWGVAGLLLAFVLFFPFNAAGILGAGDTKLLMVFGAALGPGAMVDVAALSLLVASVGAVVIIAARGRARAFAGEVGRFLRTLITPGLAVVWPKLDRKSQAPFGVAVLTGFVLKELLR